MVALMIAVVGAVTGLMLFNGGPAAEVIGLAGISGLGALFGGLLCAGFFGRNDKYAAVWALCGAMLATGCGAGLGGLLLGGASGLAIAPVMIFFGLVTQPIVGLCWIAMMVAVHFAAGALRPAVA